MTKRQMAERILDLVAPRLATRAAGVLAGQPKR
jgi:hypothetical protein